MWSRSPWSSQPLGSGPGSIASRSLGFGAGHGRPGLQGWAEDGSSTGPLVAYTGLPWPTGLSDWLHSVPTGCPDAGETVFLVPTL
jgi:hypothetical protein